jgi:hypothetical protein
LEPVEKYEAVRAPGLTAAAASTAFWMRSLLAAPERLQRALVGLVGGVAGDRERLEPAATDLAGREQAEDDQQDPGHDHPAAAADDEVAEALEHPVHVMDPHPGCASPAAGYHDLEW